MLTLIFYDAHSHNHITITICLFCSQENLYDMPTIIFYDANNDNHVTPKICLLRFQDNLHDMLCISPSVKYLSDRKIPCPMDPIDPLDHLTFAMLANPLASRLYCLALCNYVIYWSLIPFIFNRIRQFTIGKIFVRP